MVSPNGQPYYSLINTTPGPSGAQFSPHMMMMPNQMFQHNMHVISSNQMYQQQQRQQQQQQQQQNNNIGINNINPLPGQMMRPNNNSNNQNNNQNNNINNQNNNNNNNQNNNNNNNNQMGGMNQNQNQNQNMVQGPPSNQDGRNSGPGRYVHSHLQS